MKKIYLLLFLCACITSCGRVNENDMKQISNSTQGTQTNKDRIFSIEDRVYTSQKQKSKWWNIHYPDALRDCGYERKISLQTHHSPYQ